MMCANERDSGEQPGPKMIGKPRVGYSVPQFGKVFVCPCVLYSEKALLRDYGCFKREGILSLIDDGDGLWCKEM